MLYPLLPTPFPPPPRTLETEWEDCECREGRRVLEDVATEGLMGLCN